MFLVFAIHAWRPAPDPNEPHYVGKAKHFWTPDWAPRHFFLETADAHEVFYFTLGWTTLLMSLPTMVWVGRIVQWWLLAWGWTRFSRAVIPRPWLALLTAVLYVAGIERFRLAGEWVVGSLEAKGLAYAFVFFAFAAVVESRWNRAWVLLGGATALHVLVGGWACVAAAFVWVIHARRECPLRAMRLGLVGGIILGSCGLVPALLLARDVDPALRDEANRIHVYDRLPHHLYPPAFRSQRRYAFTGQVVAWLLLVPWTWSEKRKKTAALLVVGALGITLAGLSITWLGDGHRDLQASLLRYYWFRFSDALLPAGVSLAAVALWERLRSKRPRVAGVWFALLILLGAAHLVDQTRWNRGWIHPRGFKPRSGRVDTKQFADWQDACRWVKENTPPDALFLTPRQSRTFVWYTGRSEVVTRKDVPQDAAGVIEWRRRLEAIHRDRSTGAWRDSLTELSPEELRRLAADYGAEYLLTDTSPPLDLPRVFANDTYAIYRFVPRGASVRPPAGIRAKYHAYDWSRHAARLTNTHGRRNYRVGHFASSTKARDLKQRGNCQKRVQSRRHLPLR